MNEKQIKLESALQRLTLVRPSENYMACGTSIVRQNYSRHTFWSSRLGTGLSAALLLSIGFNLLQINNPERKTSEISQLTTTPELRVTDIREAGSVFRFLCLTKTTVAINNSLNLGELRGFGEWAFFQAPNNYQVTVSLLPLRDWNAIGQFEDGIISLQLNEGEVIELRNVGIGPSSLKRGGPFPVYGTIQKFDGNNVSPRLASPSEPTVDSPAILASNVPNETSERASLAITNVVAGVDTELSPLTQKYFGALLRSGECG
ncbi:MAG: hypothetical protein O3C29_14930 [Proteobacteria bacterium]|nr:hypothetical protein [Pseudomonadota bacterium]MDA1291714.1 hypothetical protein [Pseudomonadota bacterium]